ncbi:MAG: ricin-type beta-trefoil lectin domain protein [Lewinellaceae bacterium]|nr:ricin-type beta-trefoil lectin domain protein [Lewinellaceae bacterium]
MLTTMAAEPATATTSSRGTATAIQRAKSGTFTQQIARSTPVDFNKCLDLSGGNTSNGANIQLWDCTSGNDNQHWVYNGLFKTIHSSVNSGKCFDAANGSATTNNVNLQLWDCNYSNNNQKWVIDGATTVSNPANVKHIIPVLASNVAVASALGNQWGSNIQLWTKDASLSSENWYFDGWAIKLRDHQEFCIDLHDSNTDNGNNIQLWGCNDTNAQKWIYDGMNRSIRSVINPGKCMQIEHNTDGVYGKRSNIDIQDCDGSAAQQFLIMEQ